MLIADSISTAYLRPALLRRGRLLAFLSIGYMIVEGGVSIVAGALAGSVSLMGFGLDSVVELGSDSAALHRIAADLEPERRARAERRAQRIIAACFLALALYVTIDALRGLWLHVGAAPSTLGIIVAATSVMVMPLLARAKRRVAAGLESRALAADARQADFCAYLSAILLSGLLLNALLGWWWADPAAALAMAPIIAREGVLGWRGAACCDACCDAC